MLKRTTWKGWMFFSQSILSFRKTCYLFRGYFASKGGRVRILIHMGSTLQSHLTSSITMESFYEIPLRNGTAALENVWQLLKRLDIKLPYAPEIPLLEYSQEK